MKKPAGTFHRDASNRLCFEMFDVGSLEYPQLAARVVTQFKLTPVGDSVVGLDEMFRDYTDGVLQIGIEWDNWSGFVVTAKSPSAEPLVNSIGTFLTEC